MSMGNLESFHHIVDEKIVKKVVGAKLFNDFKKKFDKFAEDESPAEMSDALNDGHDGYNEGLCSFDMEDEKWVKVREAYDKVLKEFNKKTRMRVDLIYFTGDGDCYDDLSSDEWYWEIPPSNVWLPKKFTQKALAFQKKYGKIDTDQRFSCYG